MKKEISLFSKVSVLMLFGAMLGSAQVPVLTQHNDNARTGQNLNETVLNTSNVNQSSFGKLFWRTVDGFIYAQPLYVPGLTIQGAAHNVVYVATQHNSVYAFDADDPNAPAALWQVNLGTSVPSQDICIITGDTNPADCPYLDISPEIGITSTPVIDTGAGIIYVVNRTKNTSNSTYHDYLHALSLTTGAEQLGGPVEITGQVSGTGNGSSGGILTFDPTYHHQRPALLLANGVLYLCFGSVGDIGTYHGWVMSYNASTLQQETIISVTPDGNEGGVWNSGQGPVADSSGNIYILTANGNFNANGTGGRDYGDSFVKFSGSSLTVADYFTPSNQSSLDTGNIDLGSGGIMLMPGTSYLLGMGKDGIFRVVNTANMGKFNSGVDNDVQEFSATPNAFFSTPVYWNSPNYGPLAYIWGSADYLKAFQFNGTKFNTTPVTTSSFTNSSGDSNAAPISISANGSQTGSGILWAATSLTQWASGVQVAGALRAFDATNLATELWDSTQNLTRDDVGSYAKYSPPTVTNGKVYVGSFSGQLQVYGLNPPPFQGIQFVQVASATPQSSTATVSVAYPASQTAGHLNVVIVGWNDTSATVQSVTDTAGNNYLLAAGPTTGTALTQSIYYAKSILGGSNTVKVTFNQAATKPDIRILEYSGVDTSSPLDVFAGASGNNNIADSGFVTTNAANELIIGANTVHSNTTIMAGAPFTPRVITPTDSDVAEDRLVNVPGSYHSWAPLNASGAWVQQVVTFRAAASGTVPFVSSVSPSSGPPAGGTPVTITGTNFATGATVTFGSNAATNVVVVNSTTITANTPAGSAGSVTVSVTVGGQSGNLTNAFTYMAPPTVTNVNPNSGSTSGGTAVTITGTNFVTGATVNFGSTAATNVVVTNSTTITATTPAASAGAVTVTVTVNGQNASLPSGYTYIVEPTVTSVSPNNGPVAGGTAVTITGTNFATGATVTFGSNAATSVVVVNSTTITAKSPAGSAGSVTVTVTVNGQSGSLPNGFSYIVAPTVTSVAPNNGPSAGGTAVTITGTNFATGATVTFGSAAATNVIVTNSTTITAITPAGSVGAVTVTVTNVGPLSGSLANGFTYNSSVAIAFAQVASATPQTPSATVSATYPAAQTAGDLNVVIVGWNDTAATVQSVKDSLGNTYNLAVGPTVGTGLQQSIYYAANIFSGSNTVTVTFSQAATFPDVRILEYKGVTTLDVTAGATGNSAAASSGAATTTSANEVIVGANMVSTTTSAAGTGFTSRIITTPDGDIAEDKIVTAAGSNTATATLNGAGPWVMQMATFSAVSGPPPTVTSVSPNTGATGGGTAVTITGTNFVAGAAATFGSTAATNVAVVNSTTITATAPAGSGTVTVTVTNSGGQSGSLSSAFTYTLAPTVSSVSPNGGPLAGGTAVTITGANFATGATATFGSTAATNVVVTSSTTITATTPAGSAGAVTVTVTVGGQSGSLAGGFTYALPPTVTNVTPNSGSTAGGTAVTITGTNFAAGATAEIVETRKPMTNVVVVNSTTITATTPPGSPGEVTVIVTVNGQSGSLADGFDYVVVPTVTSVSPNNGPTAGGTAVTISGTNFATGATVTFGSSAATNVVVVSGTSITATTPAGSVGAVTVTVTVSGQSGSLASGFTYVATPTVASVSPNSGTTSGGTAVTITGTNFAAGATVTFGSTAATNVVVASSTTITATTPAGGAGAVTVTVTNVGGLSGSLTNGYTYIVGPTVSSVSPNNGPVAGGTAVTITGTNFATGATVKFGSTAATSVVVVSSTSITAKTPAGSAGAVTVTVTVGGQSGSLANGFTYVVAPTVTSVSPNNGPVAGGTAVTIAGTNFATGATVTFGSAAATSVVVVSGTQITAATPAGSAGAVTVTVTNVGSLSGSLANGFTYNAAAPIGFAQVASATPQTASATVSVTYPAAQTAGDLNVVVVGWNDTTSTVQTVKDSLGNIYSLAIGPTVGTGLQQSIYYAANILGGSNTVTVTFSAAAAFPDIRILEYKGITTVDVTAGATGNSAAASSGAATTTSANELIFGADLVSTQTAAAGTGFTSRIITSPDSDLAEDKIVTTAGSNTATATLNGAGPWIMQMVTFSAGASLPPPTVTNVSPASGTTAGGTAVTITGTNFAAGATVTFASTAATNVAVVNSTTITATTPAGSAGAVTVTVTESGKSGSLASGYTYVVMPTVTSVSPASGTTAGGTSVTISGTNFATGATVTFGGAAATNVVVTNSTTITANTPAGSAGAVTVTVTVGGQSGSLTSGYTYVAPPTVTSVSPASGTTSGGTAVTITGTNFVAGATVIFGSTAATNVAVVNSTTITATTPAGSAGAATVTVTESGLSGSLASGYTYVVTPTVTSVAPNSGTTAGATSVTITGTNFATGATVTFGGAAATSVVVTNSTTITAKTPAGSAGAVTVTVTVGGQSGSLTSGYTYVAPPTVTSVSPASGTTSGGTAVTITGTNFASGATVTFGSTAATNVAVVNSTTITATTPAGSAGAATVTVTESGLSGSLASGYTYVVIPTVTSVAPNSGTTAGGTAVTITGTNFATGATVTFGSTAATNVVVTNSTTITAKTPAGSVGAVTVTVTVGGQSGSLASGFTYVATPTVTSVSPGSGTTSGGTAVTITGTNFATGATVTFGSTAATNVAVTNSTTITATTPAGSAGAVTVTVTNVGSLSGSLTNGYTYVVAPTVSSVTPNNGPTAGATAVTITGTNFATGATVTFGSTAATNVVVTNSTTITAKTPAGSAGAVTVTVTVGGQSGNLASGFTYVATPTVTSVSPNNGTTLGGTAVTITGTNFATGAVTFGSTAATSVVVVSGTQITAKTPAGSAGAVTVTVTVSGQSGSLTSGYTYVVQPTVTSVSPNNGPVAGGTAVTITGTNFATGATVTFGSTAATSVVVTNSTTITAKSPAGSAGAVTVTVTVSGQSGSLANGFTYVVAPTVTSVAPNNGPAAGGTPVTITGTNFATGATVTFGSGSATSVVVVSGTQITATTPAGTGAVTVTVTNVGSLSGSLANGFTYNASVPIAFAQVASATPQSSTATVSVPYPAAQTAGDLNVVVVGWNDTTSTVQSVKDSLGNTYSLAIGPTSGTGLRQSIYYTANILAGSNTVTVTFNQAAAFPDIRILEYKGVTTLDVTAGATGSSATSSSGAATTTSANELIFGANMVATVTSAAGTGFTSRIITPKDADIAEDKIVTTAGSNTATATLNGAGPWVMQMVTFSAVSGPPPAVTSVSPNSGTTVGGTPVTITGANFGVGSTVTFGGTAATNVVVTNSTTITATTPAGGAGATTVTVKSGGLSGSQGSAFTYIAPPTVSSVSPNSGPAAGGTAATITGTNFAAGATVTFGSTAATNVVVTNSTTITATTPPGSAGAVTVTVTANGLSGNLASAFTYVSSPTVTSVSPASGTTVGGTAVTISGTNFAAGATVTFGSSAATNVAVVNGATITATTPSGNAGGTTVTVTNIGSQSGSLANGYTYVVVPTVTSVSPNSGPASGATPVTITGTNFAAGATVTFGATAAASVVVVNATTITASTPAGSGSVTVTVTSNGQSGNLANGFTYSLPPTVSSVSPNNGATTGGTPVTITGTNFLAGATVTFGGAAATSVVVVNSTTITAATPAGSTGAVTVTVTVGAQSGNLANGYTYIVIAGVTAPGNFAGALVGTSAPTYVSGQQFLNASPNTSFTSSSFNSTGADLLILYLGCHNNTVFTITDTYGNTFLPLAGPAYKVGTGNFPMEGEFFYVPNAKTGAGHTITVGLSQAEPLVMSIAAVSGDNIYSPIDAYSTITGDNGTLSQYVASSPLTTFQSNDMLLGVVKGFFTNSYTAGAGFATQSASSGTNFSVETGSAPGSGSYNTNFTATNGDFWQTVMAAIAPKPTQAVLTWSASVGGTIANYFIERCTGVGCSNFSQIASVPGTTLTYPDPSITAGTIYNYRVRAENSISEYSPYSSVQPLSPIVPYVVPSFTATPARILTWGASAESGGGSITQYSIERCTGAGCSNFTQLTTTSNTTYTDSSAAAGTTYNYRVRAQDANNFWGPYSVVSTASIPAYFDNTVDGGNNGGNTTSLTYQFTVGTNSNRLLLVNVAGDTSADDITSVTYAGVSMTLVGKVQTPGDRWHYLYYLLAPATGSNSVAITSASSHYLISEAASWYNVTQSGQPLAHTTNTAVAGQASDVTITTALPASSNGAIVAESMWASQGILPANGTSEVVADAVFQSLGIFSSVPSPVSQAYPVSMTNTWGGQAAASTIMASFSLASNGTAGITYDNSVDGGNNGGSTKSLTYSYTVGTGSNRLLVVNLIGDTVVDDISSVTYGGTALTLIGKVQAPSNNFQYVYYLLNPPSGAHNIVVTAASSHYLISQAASWFNVKQSAQPDAFTTNTAPTASTSVTTSLTTVAAGSLVVQGIWSYGHLAAGTGATPILIDATYAGAGIFASGGSPVSPAGVVNMTTISDGSQSTGVIMVSFAPAP